MGISYGEWEKVFASPTENKLTPFWKKGVNEYLIATKSTKKGWKCV